MSIKKSHQQDNLNSDDQSQNQSDLDQEATLEGGPSVPGTLNESGTGTIRVTN